MKGITTAFTQEHCGDSRCQETGADVMHCAHLAASLLLANRSCKDGGLACRGEGGAAARTRKFCVHQTESLNVTLQD